MKRYKLKEYKSAYCTELPPHFYRQRRSFCTPQGHLTGIWKFEHLFHHKRHPLTQKYDRLKLTKINDKFGGFIQNLVNFEVILLTVDII